MTHVLATHVSTENFDKDDYLVYLTRDLSWVKRNHPSQKTPITPEGEWNLDYVDFHDFKPFMERMAAFMAIASPDTEIGTMWGDKVDDHKFFIDHLKNRELEKAFDVLNDMHRSPLTRGISQSDADTKFLNLYPAVPTMNLCRCWDVLLGVLEYAGVITPQNHEQGGSFVCHSIDSLVSNMPKELVAPQFEGGVWGLKTERGIFSERNLMALYVALKIRERIGEVNLNLAEIGGGVGHVAYWLRVLGYQKIHMVDLPTIICVQAFFLAANFGQDTVSFPNEGKDTVFNFMTPDQFLATDKEFELVVNVDSMPEMQRDTVRDYLNTIAKSSKWFFSVNQEAQSSYWSIKKYPGDQRPTPDNPEFHKNLQVSVRSLIKKEFLGKFARFDRSKFWVRDGWTEEWYFTPKNSG